MHSSSSLQIPSQDSPSGARPVSATVHSSQPPPSSSHHRRQQRASHSVVSPQQSHHPTSGSREEQTLYTDVYSHPAAMAYAAAHPRRTIPKFGPYLLLQTLGEGEFGKVKLGLHCQWGEEVAVKLIRRGNIDNTVRMSKVEREIEVLRTLKHPNIVRLYDVIETDKYIGIILEYASGGELFDHILAHRYLRERDAAKLFSQLISGVWYIHQKKIVHRDLKLENLLLDRHRNVIITDFGFANRFEHRSDDLMQTSCGSPCYAAPELVISEGLYVGSAVDIWSCGVILYAMLAGYLPFDDDPANPDGDNINLLYKYIVNTPLSFPDYISAEARDLLGMMLVPDPTRRSSLEAVMRHPWLAAYATPKDGIPPPIGVPLAFGRSIDQLERAAMEQHQQKRLAYQRQMKVAAMAASQQHPSQAAAVGRSQSHYITTGSGHRAAATEPGSRSHSAQPEYLYDSSVDLSTSMSSPGPVASSSSAKRAPGPGYGSPRLGVDDDPFGPPPSASAAKAQMLNAESPRTTKPHGDFRHTIQVEYDEPKTHRSRKSEDTKPRSSTEKQGQGQLSSGSAMQQQQHSGAAASLPQTGGRERKISMGSIDVAAMKPLPPSPLVPAPSPPAASTSVSPPSSFRDPPLTQQGISSPVPVSSSPAINSVTTKGSTLPSPHSTPGKNRTRQPVPLSSPAPGLSTPNISIEAASPPATPIKFAPPSPAASSVDEMLSNQTKQGSKGHRKGRPSLDKIGLGKVFGGSQAENSPVTNGGSNRSMRVPSDANVSASGGSTKSTSSVLSSAAVGTRDPAGEKEKEKEKEAKDGKKTSRRNTLTVMVEPFRMRNRGTKSSKASGEPASAVSPVAKDKLPFKSPPPPSAATVSTSAGEAKASEGNLSVFVSGNETGELGEGAGGAGMHASTSKARKVMQWFRTKSKVRDVGNDEDEEKEQGPTLTQAGHGKEPSASNTNLHSTQRQDSRSPPIQVVVTTPSAARAPQSVVSTRPQRTVSHATTDSSFNQTPSLVTRFRNSVTIGNSSSHSPASPGSKSAAHPWGALRTHHGAVDQSTITTKPPPEVIKHVKVVLEGMGMEIYVESEYKFRCVRAKRRKGSMALGGASPGSGVTTPSSNGASAPPTPGIAAITMMGSAASNGVDKRGLPLPSPSSFSAPGGMLRGLLMRRQSSQVSTSGVASPTVGPLDDDLPLSPDTSVVQETTYGDPSHDAGDEVRFSVELTRIDRLNDTFSLDIRRLKGNLRSYKFLYDTIRERADLQR